MYWNAISWKKSGRIYNFFKDDIDPNNLKIANGQHHSQYVQHPDRQMALRSRQSGGETGPGGLIHQPRKRKEFNVSAL